MNVNYALPAIIAMLVLAGPAAAADFSVINQGDAIYIGEAGLDVTHALNQAQGTDPDGTPALTSIGWWASPAHLFDTSPSRTLGLGNGFYRCMTATPANFSGYAGSWYLLRADGTRPFSADALAFTVLDHVPAAAFSADVTEGAAPLTVTFTDASTGYPAGWDWNFGDGSSVNATDRSPVHTFTNPGTYTISLSVTNSAGSDTHTENSCITVHLPPPVADFSGTPRSGPAPLTVLFRDDSAYSPTEWNWSFGDGSAVNATDQNPVHTYANPGTYTVSLNVTNAAGSGTHSVSRYVTVFAPPAVTNSSPKSGPVEGGTLVTIFGTGFTGATAVRFGGIAGTGLTVVSANRITVRSPAHAAGIVYVTVTTPNGTSAQTATARFTYDPRPTIKALSRTSGPVAGGVLVIISGTGFAGATAVRFGGIAGTGLTVESANRITVRSPAHAAGTVNVTVTTPNGTSARAAAAWFTYAPPPTVTARTPAAGPVGGGTLVTIYGTGFAGAKAVRFGGTAGTGITVVSASRITVRSPAHAAGTVYVTVTTPNGTSAPAAGVRFTYAPRPTVTARSPATGPVAGGTLVTISGTGFAGATAVRFGGIAGTAMTIVSANRITVRSPAHAAGNVYITVTTAGGTSAVAPANRFTYTSPPAGTIANHTTTHLSAVPLSAINAAKANLHIAYWHTSHGSQITTGMSGLTTFDGAPYDGSVYRYTPGGTGGVLDLREPQSTDLGTSGWATITRNYLAEHPEVNVVMWSWCGQLSTATQAARLLVPDRDEPARVRISSREVRVHDRPS